MTMPSINTEVVPLNSIKTKSSEQMLSSRRFLAREFPVTDTSFDVYYRESSARIPFLWESRPGTPKINYRESPILPPLTPPPSFHKYNKSGQIPGKLSKNRIKNNMLMKTPFPMSPSRPSSYSSSSSSSSSSPARSSSERRIVSPRLSVDSRIEEEENCHEPTSPVSNLCFHAAGRGAERRPRGGSASIIKLLLRQYS